MILINHHTENFGERLTKAIAFRQTEMDEAEVIRSAFAEKDHPSRQELLMEAVNSLTAGLGLCFLAGMTLEEILTPWINSMERSHPELKSNSLQ